MDYNLKSKSKDLNPNYLTRYPKLNHETFDYFSQLIFSILGAIQSVLANEQKR